MQQALLANGRLREIEDRIQELESGIVLSREEIGQLLLEAKTSDEMYGLRSVREFLDWAKECFGYSEATVNRYLEPISTTPQFSANDTKLSMSFDSQPTHTPDAMDVHYSSATPEWETPQDLFDELNAEFGFEVDVCATAENAKCKLYFDQAMDGLAQEWDGVCWMNPPYGDEIKHWMHKAIESSLHATVVCLVPARTDTNWWWETARFGEVRFLKGRLRFGGAENSAPFPSAVVIFRPEQQAPKVVWWER